MRTREIKFQKVSEKKMKKLFIGSFDYLGRRFCVGDFCNAVRFFYDIWLDPKDAKIFLDKLFKERKKKKIGVIRICQK